jgi:branched-subunit amino acid aminotransferase/4-amino-4-deoxychorismate lyase
VEQDLRLEDAFAADEAAICSSIAGVVPVVAVDGRPIGAGLPGPLTMALRAARENWIDAHSLEVAGARALAASAGGERPDRR